MISLLVLSAVCGGAIVWVWMQQVQCKTVVRLTEAQTFSSEKLRRQHMQNELFHALFDAAPECIKLQTKDGSIQRINSAGLSLLETCQPSKIVGKSVYSVIAQEYHTRYQKLTEEVFSGKAAIMEFELITFRGRRRWLETHAVPMYDDGSIIGLLAITRDIDERKRMTRQLEEQRNHLHTIIESEPECVKLQSRDGSIIEMNPAGLALLCADKPNRVIGHTVYEFIREKYHQDYRDLTEEVFTGKRASMEFEVNTIDGRRRWLETHAAPLRDSAGNVAALLSITRDIDERKQYEEKLRNQRNELAHVCRLGTLGELASGFAHELNQPLCALSSYAESAIFMNSRPYARKKGKIDDLLKKIVRETERASDIIQRLRELVQRRVPQPQTNSASKLIHEVLDIVEPERRRRIFHIEIQIADQLPPVWVDRVQTLQVLINLLYNALQANYELTRSQRRINIVAHCNGDFVYIDLRDYADGIPEDIRPYLFTPFFTTKPNGIGMGLALSRNIAEAHGGSLSYQASDPGSLFRLGLPLYKDND